ncbi:methionyl-tRNA formyltransferase [Pseudovibrio exalbescens]|uniref:Methionyl-tRNA formyltransferase n=1 Tax=Pseudovibrio exalbescens TaxID=197461 RepID=A0A1U7JHH0_9HYPH|nr:methionyl-tRNA formyltransferase [Pseudovibrio exalbescens]OKL44193.1 methionyl-tRNA formyltransferase [Pseudovibrio exalbescens]
MTLRIVFMGTPEFSVPTLMEVVGQGWDVVACYSQPPRKSGRGMELHKTPVHEAAESLGIPVFTPTSLKSEEEQERFRALEADVAVVVAYGLLLPRPILEAPEFGCLNGHASLLPRWRGAAPINRAIMAGDTETGIQVMRMEAGLDTGPVCMSETVAITPNMTAGELHDHLSPLCGDVMVRALSALSRGGLTETPQSDEGITYASKIEKTETRIDWTKPATEVHNHIRGLSSFPGAWTEMNFGGKPERVKVLRSILAEGSGQPGEILAASGKKLLIACGDGAVELTQVQRAGKKAMSAEELLRGGHLEVGTLPS